MKIVLISDTHSMHSRIEIPECDLLIHAGDWTWEGKFQEVTDFAKWLATQPAKDIILVPGNHEVEFAKNYPDSHAWISGECPRAHILIEESLELNGINFWGSGYTPAFGFGWAYNAGRGIVEAATLNQPFIGDIWAKIPENTNFLITHGMPYGILDDARRNWEGKVDHVGDKELLKRMNELPELKWVVGGHLHACGGKSYITPKYTVYNAAICDDNYLVNRKPIIIEID